jgi:hypothetical protein
MAVTATTAMPTSDRHSCRTGICRRPTACTIQRCRRRPAWHGHLTPFRQAWKVGANAGSARDPLRGRELSQPTVAPRLSINILARNFRGYRILSENVETRLPDADLPLFPLGMMYSGVGVLLSALGFLTWWRRLANS